MNSFSDSKLNEDATEAIAAAWIVEREEGFTPARAEQFERWQNSAAIHAAAINRLEATHRLLSQLPQLGLENGFAQRLQDAAAARPAGVVRFPFLKLAVAAAALIAVGFALWRVPHGAEFEQRFGTSEAGMARVTLPDDSRVELTVQSEIAVKYSARARDVALTRGTAHFAVAKDPSRPFVVSAGRVKVRAVGTAFDVRLGDTGVEVVVSEGKVQVSRAAEGSAQADEHLAALVAGQRLEVPTRGPAAIPAPAANPVAARVTVASPAATPLSSRLVFSATPLSTVIDEFNRRNQIQLVLGDADLGDRPVGGTFDGENVEAFVRLLESTGEISAEWTYNSTIVLRKGN